MERVLAPIRRLIPGPLLNAVRKPYHFGWALLGNVLYRFPGRKLRVIGVTGTKGKSTTAYLAAKVLEAGGHKVGLLSGVTFKIGAKEWPNRTLMTTQGRLANYRLLRKMANAGCTHVVIEVTSHALHWNRVWGIPFETAVFTNLAKDHLELHGSIERYRATKGRLFKNLRASDGQSTAIVNGADPEAAYFLSFFSDVKYVFGTGSKVADVHPLARTVTAGGIKQSADGSTFTLQSEEGNAAVNLHLPGPFNVQNALGAAAVGLAYNETPATIAKALDDVPGVPGRMERIAAGQPFTVVVDFAHTPDSFEAVLSALREVTKGKLISVFGAPGNRDASKFPAMGRIAAQYSDQIFLTEDDPGTEDPAELVKPLIKGIKQAKRNAPYKIELDRRKAIHVALNAAKRGDTVVLLAKGHQTTMRYGRGNQPWDERTVATEELKKLKH